MSTTLLAILDQAYDRQSWHGTNLRGALRRVSAAEAAWRPGPGRHNIWELAVHCAYWKYTVMRRLTGKKRGSFPLAGSNWFARPTDAHADEAAWRADLVLLERIHRELRAAVAELPSSRIDKPASGAKSKKITNAWLITGAAAHDLYHAGQIQLIRKLTPPRP